MTLIVEDGTGLADADALISLEYANAYHAERGNVWTASSTEKEQAIRRASRFLSDSFIWDGLPKRPRVQSLAWPRTNVTDRDGYAVTANAVPPEIQRAVAEIALQEAATPGSMNPTYTPSGRVKSERVGDLAVEYDLSRTDEDSARPILLIVRDMVSDFLDAGGTRLVGEARRG